MTEWQSLNRLVRHSEHEAVQVGETSKSMCLEQGTCVCKSSVWHYHCKFVALMCKPHFLPKRDSNQSKARAQGPETIPQPAGPSARLTGSAPSEPKVKKKAVKTPHRILAEQGFLVVRVSACKGRITSHADNSWVQLAARSAGRGDQSAELPAITDGQTGVEQEEEQLQQSLWYHLGFMNFRTWQYTVTPLNYSHSDEEGVHLLAQDPLGCCLHLDFVKQNQDLRPAWVAQYYTVLSTGTSLAPADMLPAHVTVRSYKGLPPLKVWLGEEVEARMRRQQRSRGGQRRQGLSQASFGAGASHSSRSRGGSAFRGATDSADGPRPSALQLPSGDENSGSDNDHDVEDRLINEDPTPMDEAAADLEDLDQLQHDDVPDITGGQASSSSRGPVDPRGPTDRASASGAGGGHGGGGRGGVGGGERSGTEIVYNLGPGRGSVRYYPVSCTMQAYCPQHGSDCRKTRTVKPGRQEHQGRPLGFLLSWLQDCANHETKQQHIHEHRKYAHAVRAAAREEFMQREGAIAFAEHERARRDNEGPEPLSFS